VVFHGFFVIGWAMCHICHVTTTFDGRAGSARRTYAVLRGLGAAGYTVSLVCGREFAPRGSWDLSGIRVRIIPEMSKYVDLRSDVLAVIRLIRELRALRPSVVHTHLAKAGILGRVAAWISRVPLVVHTVHGPTFAPGRGMSRALFLGLELICAKVMTDYMVFVGDEIRRFYLRFGVGCSERSRVVRTGFLGAGVRCEDLPGGARMALRRELCGGHDVGFLVGYFGRIVPSKNHFAAVEGVGTLRKMGLDAELAIVGSALLEEEKDYERKLRRRVLGMGLDGVVHFCGYREDVLACMRACDAVVLTSRYEGLPNVLVEAGMAGRVVVAFDTIGVREVVRDGYTGFVVRQGDVRGLSERLAELALNPDMRVRMEEELAGRMWEEFRCDYMVREKLRFYEEIISVCRSFGCRSRGT